MNKKNKVKPITKEQEDAVWEEYGGYGSKAWDEFWKDKDLNDELGKLFDDDEIMIWFGDNE